MRNIILSFILLLLYIPNCVATPLNKISNRRLTKQLSILDKTKPYSFIIISDPQYLDNKTFKVLEAVGKQKPLFVLVGGDIAQNGLQYQYTNFISAVRQNLKRTPVFCVAGNHDRTPGNLNLFHQYIGKEYWTLKLPNTRIVGVDTSTYSISDSQLNYLAEQLSLYTAQFYPNKLFKFTLTHMPPTKIVQMAPGYENIHGFSDQSGLALIGLLENYKVDTAFFGHIHSLFQVLYNNIPYWIVGGSAGEGYLPYQFYVKVTIRQLRYTIKVVRI